MKARVIRRGSLRVLWALRGPCRGSLGIIGGRAVTDVRRCGGASKGALSLCNTRLRGLVA